MGKHLEKIEMGFLSLVFEGRSAEAEDFIVGKIKEGKVNRRKIVVIILDAAKKITNAEGLRDSARQNLALDCLRICAKINLQKKMGKVIEHLVAEAHCDLGVTLYELGSLRDAEAHFRKAIELNPKHALAYSNLGATLDKLGKVREAEECYISAIRIRPRLPNVHYNMGVLQDKLGKFEEAISSYKSAIGIDSNLVVAHDNLGITLSKLGRLEEAEASHREAIRINPNFAEAYCNLGITLRELGKLEEAEASFRTAVKLNSKYALAYGNLGVTLNQLGKFKDAEAAYREAIKINPDYATAHNDLGVILRNLGKLEEARTCLERAVGINPDSAEAHFNLGLVFSDLMRTDEAEWHYGKAIELDPKHAAAYSMLGVALSSAGRVEDAEAHFRKAIELNPQLQEAFYNLALVLYSLGRLKEAEERLRKAIEIDPSHSIAHSNLGVILYRFGMLDEAKFHFSKSIEIDPKYAKGHNNLAIALVSLGRIDEAKFHLEKAVKLDPNYADALCNLGSVLHNLGRLEEAEAYLRKAIKIEPNHATSNYNMAGLLFRMNRFDEAKPHLQIAKIGFIQEGKKERAAGAEALTLWMEGLKSWQSGDLQKAKGIYSSASKLFGESGERKLAILLGLIAEYFNLDRQYLSYIMSNDLSVLKEGISSLSRRIKGNLRIIRGLPIAEAEVLRAKATCIGFLEGALLLKPVKEKKLLEAKQIFAKHHFLKAYEGATAIDVFARYLNHFSLNKNLDEMSKEEERELFKKLNAAIELDGVVTQQFAKMIARSLKPELYSTVTEPMLKTLKEAKTELLTEVKETKETVEVIDLKVSDILERITVKKVAYSEFEVVFPTHLGFYKIHVPAGELTTKDIVEIRTEISTIFTKVMEKAKQTSTRLYEELKVKRLELTRRILNTMKILRGQKKE